ncbi:hypothetical protein [Nonomuraea sp. NPDC050643]|uniref:hypothetical protein n=1 Tax=Nonomuraea sp. NPDC050643 TaxID=3155660 RepID=UPI0033EC9295
MGFSWAHSGAAALTAAWTVTLTAAALTAGPAQARVDHDPCDREFQKRVGGVWHTVQICREWGDGGKIPVHANTSLESPVVGWIWIAGDDWYECGLKGGLYNIGGGEFVHDWWARTMADNDRWGYVSQIYFTGQGQMEADAGLRLCDP